MCLGNKDKPRCLTSRRYIRSSGYRFLVLLKKKYRRVLVVEVTNDKGNIDFALFDKTYGTTQKLENPETGTYEFLIREEHGYRIMVSTKSACGGYKLSIRSE